MLLVNLCGIILTGTKKISRWRPSDIGPQQNRETPFPYFVCVP